MNDTDVVTGSNPDVSAGLRRHSRRKAGQAFGEREGVTLRTGELEFEPGDVFAGRYEVQQLLGEGDRKRTFLARDTKMHRFVALSFVKQDAISSDPEGTEREARVLGRIGSHPKV